MLLCWDRGKLRSASMLADQAKTETSQTQRVQCTVVFKSRIYARIPIVRGIKNRSVRTRFHWAVSTPTQSRSSVLAGWLVVRLRILPQCQRIRRMRMSASWLSPQESALASAA